jgi:hypothetical protein
MTAIFQLHVKSVHYHLIQHVFALVTYHLGSHAFCSVGDPRTYPSPILELQPSTTMLSSFAEMGISLTFVPRVASNHNPPNLNFLSSWDYRSPAPGQL